MNCKPIYIRALLFSVYFYFFVFYTNLQFYNRFKYVNHDFKRYRETLFSMLSGFMYVFFNNSIVFSWASVLKHSCTFAHDTDIRLIVQKQNVWIAHLCSNLWKILISTVYFILYSKRDIIIEVYCILCWIVVCSSQHKSREALGLVLCLPKGWENSFRKYYAEIFVTSHFVLLFCCDAHKTFVGGFLGRFKVLIQKSDHFQ